MYAGQVLTVVVFFTCHNPEYHLQTNTFLCFQNVWFSFIHINDFLHCCVLLCHGCANHHSENDIAACFFGCLANKNRMICGNIGVSSDGVTLSVST